MKKLRWLALVLLLTLQASVLFAQQGYLLVCRGGGDLYFNYTPYSNFSQEPQIWITFKKGSQGVGQSWEQRSSLQPGQAAWLDRRVEATEPERIIITGVKDFSISWTKGAVMGISSSLPYLNILRDPNKFQSFMVINDGRGNFIVTGVGPSM
jgi:hypothetical protein